MGVKMGFKRFWLESGDGLFGLFFIARAELVLGVPRWRVSILLNGVLDMPLLSNLVHQTALFQRLELGLSRMSKHWTMPSKSKSKSLSKSRSDYDNDNDNRSACVRHIRSPLFSISNIQHSNPISK